MQISLFDASAQGISSNTYSESWTVNYQPVYSCVTLYTRDPLGYTAVL